MPQSHVENVIEQKGSILLVPVHGLANLEEGINRNERTLPPVVQQPKTHSAFHSQHKNQSCAKYLCRAETSPI
jgi:hypothetical protein